MVLARLPIPSLSRTIQINTWATGIRYLYYHPTQDRHVIGYFRGHEYVIDQPKKQKMFILSVYRRNDKNNTCELVSQRMTNGYWAIQSLQT